MDLGPIRVRVRVRSSGRVRGVDSLTGMALGATPALKPQPELEPDLEFLSSSLSLILALMIRPGSRQGSVERRRLPHLSDDH